ncbi:cAMP-binding protein [Bernardetia litoralis DSM 6794]|uniref:cAMP-binding protein n=1 Tax=Bernardetia litoralis (strain ATCC 23117 / DSM 6794 / NBRC 15988 / NCIMB 1366 / Fx l1 / Sio-4) TaxID=880071 RepID=I4AHN2_BERLS|nr:Crp/Fnr family transcriptional regulator [Bernardetia litoralis]AFM03467.1 cAMP-binding protein [Bernardetia litoralis DSM 6794]
MKENLINLFNLLDSFYLLHQDTKLALAEIIQTKEYKNGEIILSQGDTNKHLYFLEKGLVRAFYYKDEKELTSWIFPENTLFISVYSFLTQTPSFETIEAIEDCKIHFISYSKLQELYNLHLDLNVVGRKLTEMYYIQMAERATNLRMIDSKTRYENFIKNYPNLINRTPLGYVASYLGMSQETLSRIRRS